jgi:hypothetical protein
MSKSIVYGKWGRMGRLGNQMFELAALYSMGKRWSRAPELPSAWKYQQYFKHQVKIGDAVDTKKDVCEPAYEFTGWGYWNRAEEESGETMSVSGWLQSSKYFSREIAKELFEFTEEFTDKIDEWFSDTFFMNPKPVIMIGFRVGKDYKDNGNYEILSPLYQISALYKHFPNWREEYNVLVFSDDYQYAKLNMDCHENIYFAEGFTDVEQLYLGTLCTHFILPNSTFSWWQAYLGEKEDSVVIHPSKYFKGYLQTISSTKDFWEDGWISHDYKGELLDMKDVCFTIPVKYDHEDRKENLQLVLRWINSHFKTNICVGEQGGSELSKLKGWNSYIGFSGKDFHRTKFLNDMAESRDEPIIVNFDCDNICPILQMMIGVDMIRKGEADGVYPYDGRVARVGRKDYLTHLYAQNGDCGIFGDKIFRGTRAIDPLSVGHIIIWNKEKFFEGGGENEHFISYGPEDVERKERFEKLGYRIERVKGIVYHIDHWCGPDSSGMNPKFGRNYDELERIRKMNKEELRREVNRWPQTKKEVPI